mmetsp:Transcript_3946/g.10116  ORF Transcript_3946/g.10116 Transcript_3946/m.10116 type:complete len:370 (-) Transcript_3946:25-1134(-)
MVQSHTLLGSVAALFVCSHVCGFGTIQKQHALVPTPQRVQAAGRGSNITDATFFVANSFEVALATVLEKRGDRPSHDTKLYIGITLYFLSARLLGRDEKWRLGRNVEELFKILCFLGINLIVLVIRQHISDYASFTAHLFVLILANQVLPLRRFAASYNEAWRLFSPDSERRPQALSDITGSTIYLNFERPFCRALVVFVGQSILMACYTYALWEEENAQYLHWFVGFVAVQLVSFSPDNNEDSPVGNPWDVWQWAYLLGALSQGNIILTGGRTVQVTIQTSTCYDRNLLRARAFMSFLVNAVFRDLLVFTIPAFLLDAGTVMDVVKDCLAIAFITTLDDVSNGGVYTVEFSQFKSGLQPAPRNIRRIC